MRNARSRKLKDVKGWEAWCKSGYYTHTHTHTNTHTHTLTHTHTHTTRTEDDDAATLHHTCILKKIFTYAEFRLRSSPHSL